jgi:Tol biopolymer transport system component
LEGVLELLNGGSQYSLSTTGSLVYVPGGAQTVAERLVWVSRNGAEQSLAAPPHNYVYPRLSPDGRRLAVSISEQETQVWVYDLVRDTLTRLTFAGNVNTTPAWTPDGKRVGLTSNKEGPPNIFWELADGSGGLERLTTSNYINAAGSFSPDGQLLVYVEVNPTTGFDIWTVRLSDHSANSLPFPGQAGQGRKPEPLLRTEFNEAAPVFSPDGHWLAYISDESDRYEVYVQPYPGSGAKYQISTEGGTEPVWNP